jgi:asparagine synthase (glutamine-hydrolysing)
VCGIAGILNVEPGPPPSRPELESMAARLRHRGPDDEGFLVADEVGLAHTRLSIIDLEGGHQPIRNEDGTVWVVFNGEIFNYKELQPALSQAGHSFYTRSDTEVIVHAYEQHGLDFTRHLNGQFAIALWDARRRRLVLARDRVGIRPLFYRREGGRLLFASEVKALLALPGARRALDLRGLGQALTLWAPLSPRTMFEGVCSLSPGHVMVLEGGRETLSRYWDWSLDPDAEDDYASLDRRAEELRALLVDAVRLQLRADVPVGAYLSGGLDSSVITASIKTFSDTPLRTFSITFEDAEFDETPYQAELVRHLGTHHTAVRCTREDIGRAFPKTVWHAEATVVRTAPTPLLLLSRRVRDEGFKVVLTGEGADEVFAGYDIFKEGMIRRFWARQPTSRRRPTLLRRLYPYLAHSPASAPAFAEGFFRQGLESLHEPFFGHLPRWTTTRRSWRFLSPETHRALDGYDPLDDVRASLPPEIGSWPPLGRDQYVEAHTLLSGYLLSAQGDRMAMAHSVEGRYPFLDHRVIEFGNRLPPLCKLFGLREKHVLKRAMGDLLPETITRRTKQPYRAPDSASFFLNGRPLDYVAELLAPRRLREAGYFQPEPVARLVEKCRAGRAIGFGDNMAFVGILSTMLLDEMFVQGRLPVSEAGGPGIRPARPV